MSMMKKDDWEKALREALEQVNHNDEEISLHDLIKGLISVRRIEIIEELDTLADLEHQERLTDTGKHLQEYLRLCIHG